MTELEAAGEVIGGAGAARAIEPGHGEASDHPTHCENCGTALAGDYCYSCGQKGHIHKTIGGLLHDLIHGVLHLDGKLWRTLPLLAVYTPLKTRTPWCTWWTRVTPSAFTRRRRK